jgi:hypothetical protein
MVKWTRLLYDRCCEHGTQSTSAELPDICFPILLDAQDVIHCFKVVLKY